MIKRHFNFILAASMLFTLAACSSSTSSSSGRGQIPSGIYRGVFNAQSSGANNPVTPLAIRAQLSLTVPTTSDGESTTVDNANISGSLAITGGSRCFGGGNITSGNLNGDQLTLEITTNDGFTLNLTGRTTSDSYNGTFSTSGSQCDGPLSGGFEFDRA